MRSNPSRLRESDFDVLIVGGGITGACAAHDAALRGFSVALIERADFGAATSAASSRLLHGGIRYLQQLRLDKVRESARERNRFERLAPHLVRRIPVVIPAYPGVARGRLALAAAVRAHARLVRDLEPEGTAPEYLTARECVSRVPLLAGAGVTGAYVISECQMISSERMTLAFVLTAAAHGAVVANYVSAKRLVIDGRSVTGVTATDHITGEEFAIRARSVLLARGPWIGEPLLGQASASPGVHWNSKGVHAVTRQLSPEYAVALATRRPSLRKVGRGGRHVFVQPWHGGSLIGTTNSPSGPAPIVERSDIEHLLADVNRALPDAKLRWSDVRHAYVGLFPNTRKPSRPDIYQGTGDWMVIDHGRTDGCEGLFSVGGAKFTTARALAERAVDAVARRLGASDHRCRTADTPLLGGSRADISRARKDLEKHLSRDIVEHVIRQYGADAAAFVLSAGIEAVQPLTGEHWISAADVRRAVVEEHAVHLEDVILRRTTAGAQGMPSEHLLRQCAAIAGDLLGWSADTRRLELDRVVATFPIRRLIDAG
jgi:glycerol-3-phosphate dehydrogenase